MTGIVTMYRGIRFRSRAEARWAALFDGIGWRWHYEAVDLSGYIPDFIVDLHSPLLVEVKGGVLPADLTTSEQINMACSKIEVSGWTHEAMVVGAAPLMASGYAGAMIGMLCDTSTGEGGRTSGGLFHCLACDAPSLHSHEGGWGCRRCGAYDGDRYVGHIYIEAAWATACNATQWQRSELSNDRTIQ